MPTYKFDKEADRRVQAMFEPLFDVNGKRIVMPGVFKARIAAQMASHMARQAAKKNPSP